MRRTFTTITVTFLIALTWVLATALAQSPDLTPEQLNNCYDDEVWVPATDLTEPDHRGGGCLPIDDFVVIYDN